MTSRHERLPVDFVFGANRFTGHRFGEKCARRLLAHRMSAKQLGSKGLLTVRHGRDSFRAWTVRRQHQPKRLSLHLLWKIITPRIMSPFDSATKLWLMPQWKDFDSTAQRLFYRNFSTTHLLTIITQWPNFGKKFSKFNKIIRWLVFSV